MTEEIVRYFSPGKIDADVLVTGALMLPPAHAGEMSCDRLHYDTADLDLALGILRSRSRLTLKPNGRYFQWNVGEIIQGTSDLSDIPALRAECDPLAETDAWPANPAHALVLPMPQNSLESDFLLDVLRPLVRAVHPAIA